MKNFAIGLAAAVLLASPAAAATFSYSTNFNSGVGAEWTISADSNTGNSGILGQLSSNGAASATLSQTSSGASAANAGTLTFDLLGFNTLDGFNCCTDTLNLIINGSTIFTGTFAMGGGGGEGFTGPAGTLVSGSGQTRTITVPFTAVLGVNTFQFLYPSLQGLGDESFGLDNVSFGATVTAPTGPVPEPASWALMILGLGSVGAALRTRRRTFALS